MLVLTGLAYLFTFMQPAGASGTVLVELSSAGGDRLAPTTVKLGPKTLNVAGDAPRAPKVKEAARLSLPPGTYRLTVGGVPQPAALTVADNQVQPILLLVSRARVVTDESLDSDVVLVDDGDDAKVYLACEGSRKLRNGGPRSRSHPICLLAQRGSHGSGA